MFKYQKYFWVCLALSGLVACASEEEKEQRQDNAYDISGSYVATGEAGLSMNINITNESGRHDILVTLQRNDSMTQKEQLFLMNLGLNTSAVSAQFGKNMVMGKGNTGSLNGGENISTDMGESSEFFVCTDDVIAKSDINSEISLRYCLGGTLKKNSHSITGALTLHSTVRQNVVENGQSVQKLSTNSMSISYTTSANSTFYTQYFGLWSGSVYSYADGFPFQFFQQIQIDNLLNAFSVRLTQTNQITYAGEVYVQQVNQKGLEIFINEAYPAVQLIFVAPSNQRIVLVGQIWSLGDFSGSVIHIDNFNQSKDLAVFQLKKL